MIRIESQSVLLRPRSPSDSSPWERTEWFLARPARYGGGEIVVTARAPAPEAATGLVVELKRDSGERMRPCAEERDGVTAWIWPAADETPLCRLLVRRTGPHLPHSFAVEQEVEDFEAGERLVLALRSTAYGSKLLQVQAHGTRIGDAIVADDHRPAFVSTDPRDHFVTRFIPLERGVYELRLTWPRGSDVSRLFARPQLRDFSWLPAVTTASESDAGITTMSSFEVKTGEEQVRLHFVPSGSAALPTEIRVVRLVGHARAPVANRVSVTGSSPDDAVSDQAIRGLAALGDASTLVPLLRSIAEERLGRLLNDDPWLHNYAKNLWEFVHGRAVLTTYPPDVCVPIADVCNARCNFCTSWLEGTRIATLEEIDGFEQVFRLARWVGLAGHGEPLAHPRIREILTRLGAWLDPRAEGYVITNGIHLPGLLEDLVKSRIRSFAISLNAASAGMHQEVMGLPEGSFDRILAAIRSVVARPAAHGLRVSVSMVVTRQNLPEVPAFVDLSNRLGVSKVQLKTLAAVGGHVKGLNYHLLPPYGHPNYRELKANAVAAIEASQVPVQVDTDSWDVQAFPAPGGEPLHVVSREEALASRAIRGEYRTQPKYRERTKGKVVEHVLDFDGVNPFGRMAPFSCSAPYSHLYVNDFSFSLSPCCYLTNVPGAEPAIYEPGGSFVEAWNSDALVTLRRRLRDGPLFNMCTKCPGTY